MNFILPLIALSMTAEVELAGRITGAEIVFLICAPFIFLMKTPRIPEVRQFYILAFLWLFGAIITDVIQQTPSEDVMRGWSKIGFLIINFTALRVLVGTRMDRLILFILFLYVAGSIRLALGLLGDELQDEALGNGWKFGHGWLATFSAFLLAARLQTNIATRLPGLAVPFLMAGVNFMLNARSLAGVTTLAGAIVVFAGRRRKRMSPAFIVGAAVATIVVGTAILQGYSYAAGSGLLGEEARAKYEQQAGSSLGIVLGGRGEPLASTQAIIDSPIIGHGSWARDIRYVELMVERLRSAGLPVQGNPYRIDLIPTHSHLLGAWVESGILGALFWFWALRVVGRAAFRTTVRPSPLTGLIVFLALSMAWDIVFSPFGLERRVIAPAILYLMILVVNGARGPQKEASE